MSYLGSNAAQKATISLLIENQELKAKVKWMQSQLKTRDNAIKHMKADSLRFRKSFYESRGHKVHSVGKKAQGNGMGHGPFGNRKGKQWVR